MQLEAGKVVETTWHIDDSSLPPEFARVDAVYGDVGHLNRLVFGGCFDDKAALVFDGLDGTSPRQIRLIPSERQRDEVVWRASLGFGEE